jgi:hypothetical protein
MMLGSEPFAGTITERPIGITSGERLPVPATRGCRARSELTRRVVAHDQPQRHAPRSRSAAAWSSACSTTAPPEGPRERDDDAHLHLERKSMVHRRCGSKAFTTFTADHRRRAPRNVGLLHAASLGLRARPRRLSTRTDPTVLPPLLRRREGQCRLGHHLLRVPRGRTRQGWCGDWCTRSSRGWPSPSALDFWEARLDGAVRTEKAFRFEDPEGVRHELTVNRTEDESGIAAKHTGDSRGARVSRASTGSGRTPIRPATEPPLCSRTRSVSSRAGDYTWEARARHARRVSTPTTARRRIRGIPGAVHPCTTSRGRRTCVIATTTPGDSASPKRPVTEETDARVSNRILLQVDLIFASGAERILVRSWLRSAPASPSTKDPEQPRRAALAAAPTSRTLARADRSPS